jgi:Kef-type K+ transport system membrane component KefB
MDTSFANLLGVMAVAFCAPLALGFFPRVRIPSVVVELTLGILLGPAVLDVIHADDVVLVISTIGLSFLLFMAGLELNFSVLRGRYLRLAMIGFIVSLVLAVMTNLALYAMSMVLSPLLVAIALASTSVGIVIPVLKDAEQVDTEVGRLVVANSSIAEFMTVALLTVFFSTEGKAIASQLVVLAIFAGLSLGLFLGLIRLWHQMGYLTVLNRLKDTTAQIRIRAAILILLAAVVLAGHFGLETVLGAFMAGAILSVLHRGWADDPEIFRTKLSAIAFGFFVPVFFVTSGLQFDLDALFRSPSTVLRIPLYLALLLFVRGLPALLYRHDVDRREVSAAALLQATSLSFILVAVSIGTELHKMTAATGAALTAAALLSVLLFPAGALSLLRRRMQEVTRPSLEEAPPVGEPTRGMEGSGQVPMEPDTDFP